VTLASGEEKLKVVKPPKVIKSVQSAGEKSKSLPPSKK